ncbi:hypothetical protein EAG_06484 [Camponotus floridanus]|uniref:Uncharacterized protein n=1 Tax=Camponotus floridanus TaxID=104421 RepID=E1ZYE3_CAMFO|nr:hypothetical protein EAG_06484 [Camponotus floridanus]
MKGSAEGLRAITTTATTATKKPLDITTQLQMTQDYILQTLLLRIVLASKANEIQSLCRIHMTRKPHSRYRPIGNKSTRRRLCSYPIEDYQTAKRCFVVTNNKQISSGYSGEQRLLHAHVEGGASNG